MLGEHQNNLKNLNCSKIHPANLIRLDYSRNKLWFRQFIVCRLVISANTLGLIVFVNFHI